VQKYINKNLLSKVISALCLASFFRLCFFIFNGKYLGVFRFAEYLNAFFVGVLFDISALGYCLILFFTFYFFPAKGKIKNILLKIADVFLIIGLIAFTIPELIDLIYFPFTKKRMGSEVLFLNDDLQLQIPHYLKEYWYLIIIIFLLIWIIYKIIITLNNKFNYGFSLSIIKQLFVFIILLPILFLSIRASFNIRPLSTKSASKYVNPELVPLAINTFHQLISTVQTKAIFKLNYFNDVTAEKIFPTYRNYFNPKEIKPKPNVVIIIVESLGKEYMKSNENSISYTPFLDSLFKKSLTFKYAFASGKRSIDAVPAIIGGIPALMNEAYITSVYQANPAKSIGYYLKTMNYSCNFYHGGANGTMSFDDFIAISGHGNYFGKNEYKGNKEDDDGNWGISDEPYLNYFLKESNKTAQPFCNTIFTLSSHHPFEIPKKYEGKFPIGTLPIHKAIAYTDFCLKQYFSNASKENWYNNTWFIITGDHTSISDNQKFQNPRGDYEVPITLFHPKIGYQYQDTSTIAQHIDILPTILHLTNYKKSFNAFGRSLISKSERYSIAIQLKDNLYQIFENKYLYRFDGENGIGLYNFKTDTFMSKNILSASSHTNIDLRIKAVLQHYNRFLNKGKL
jgi:phosphoglycerol transferase MdoB-like AlkP superfamily enzyme